MTGCIARNRAAALQFIGDVRDTVQRAIAAGVPPQPFYVSPVVMEQVRKVMKDNPHYRPSTCNSNTVYAVRLLSDLGVLYRLPTQSPVILTAEDKAAMNPLDWENYFMWGADYMRRHMHETAAIWKDVLMWATGEAVKEKLKADGKAELWSETLEQMHRRRYARCVRYCLDNYSCTDILDMVKQL